MSEIKADLCPTCPARGLCVGEVDLGVERGSIRKLGTPSPSVELIGKDADGVKNTIDTYTPSEFEVIRKGKRITVSNENDHLPAIVSNLVFNALNGDDQDGLLSAISRRAAQCEAPGYTDDKFRKYRRGMRLIEDCRSTAPQVLRDLLLGNNSQEA